MKTLRENPLTRDLHSYWRSKINTSLGLETNYLSVIHYLESSPKKYYSKEGFSRYFKFLSDALIEDPNLLALILNESEYLLGDSNHVLNEINDRRIHDTLVSSDKGDVIDFIDKEIHFNLLKLYEMPIYTYSIIVAKYNRLRNKKGVEKMDLYNVIDDLKTGPFSFISSFYNNTIRNGIAHGKVYFNEHEIEYIDKKSNNEIRRYDDVVKLFDDLVDVANALCLAVKIFLFSNPKFLVKYRVNLSKSLLIEELKTVNEIPGWKIVNCFENVVLGNRKQLTVHVTNENWDSSKVNWYCFSAAYAAESLTQGYGYDRIFISLSSSHSLPGWAAFNAKTLRALRENGVESIEEYFKALEEGTIFFIPKFKFPKIIYKLGTYRNTFRALWSLFWLKRKDEKTISNYFEVRDSVFHSRSYYVLIQTARLVINAESPRNSIEFIRDNHRHMVNEVKRYSKRKLGPFSVDYYKPIQYVKLFIYDTNRRVRSLRARGLTSELIATIEINRTDRIKTIDILNGNVEQIGRYRIVWYKHWRGLTEVDTIEP